MEDQKVFGWDDEIENEEGSFTVFEPGIYKFTVTGFDRERYPGGDKIPACLRANLELTVEDDFGRETTVKESLFLIGKMEWKLCQFFTCLGLRKHGEKSKMPWDKILGRSGMCELIKDKYESKNNGKEYDTNRVKEYLDPEKNPLPAPQPAGAASWKSGKW